MNEHHVSDQTWRKLQAITGLVFALFVFIHLGNALLALGGIEIYNNFQRAIAHVYQHPIVEIGLLFFVLPLHLLAGFKRNRMRRTAIGGKTELSLRLHRIAGWFLAFVVYYHAAAVRGPAIFYAAWPRFEGVSFSLHWFAWWFYPYYFLLALFGFYHALNGSRLALSALAIVRRPFPRSYLSPVTTIAAILFVLSLCAFGGLWFDVGDPFASDYAQVYLNMMTIFE